MKGYDKIIRVSNPVLYPHWGKCRQTFLVFYDGDRHETRTQVLQYLADKHGAYDIVLYRQEIFDGWDDRMRTTIEANFWHVGITPRYVKP